MPGPSRCSNHPLPSRVIACAIAPWAWVIFGKWPMRIFVSAETEFEKIAAAAIRKVKLKIFTVGRDLDRDSVRQQWAKIPLRLGPLFQWPRDHDSSVAAISLQISRQARIDQHPSVIVCGRSVHEMENA